MTEKTRLIVGITGASGVIYGVRALELLQTVPVETHLIVSKSAELTLGYETDRHHRDLESLATVKYAVDDIGAAISSGSFRTMGMLIAPCTVRTMSEIATGVTSSLMSRAADVVLKERRRLMLMVRETPLHLGHLRTMTALTEMGAIVMPPVPAFYADLKSVDEMVTQSVARALDLFDIELPDTRRWGEDLKKGRRKGPSRKPKPGARG